MIRWGYGGKQRLVEKGYGEKGKNTSSTLSRPRHFKHFCSNHLFGPVDAVGNWSE